MKIIKEGISSKFLFEDYRINCPFCNCEFEFEDNEVEIVTSPIPYEKGIRKLLQMNKGYKIYKYITCIWCKNKLRLKYSVDDIEGLEFDLIWKE